VATFPSHPCLLSCQTLQQHGHQQGLLAVDLQLQENVTRLCSNVVTYDCLKTTPVDTCVSQLIDRLRQPPASSGVNTQLVAILVPCIAGESLCHCVIVAASEQHAPLDLCLDCMC
jgi:hypothetical protein